jgi:hypothetical protein
MTMTAADLEEFSAAQLERGARQVRRIRRAALIEVMGEAPMTVEAATTRAKSRHGKSEQSATG